MSAGRRRGSRVGIGPAPLVEPVSDTPARPVPPIVTTLRALEGLRAQREALATQAYSRAREAAQTAEMARASAHAAFEAEQAAAQAQQAEDDARWIGETLDMRALRQWEARQIAAEQRVRRAQIEAARAREEHDQAEQVAQEKRVERVDRSRQAERARQGIAALRERQR